MKIIDDNLINGVVEQAKQSPRLRMNYNFHQSLDEKCHRFLNALEPGTVWNVCNPVCCWNARKARSSNMRWREFWR